MRPFPLTVLQGGINRLRVKGGASINQLYDLTNAYVNNAGAISPREGTLRTATLSSVTVGLAAANGTFNVFAPYGALSPPTLRDVISSATGGDGTFVSGTTYYFVVAAYDKNSALTTASNEISVLATGTHFSVTLAWLSVPGASGYNLYYGTSSGGENKYYAGGGLDVALLVTSTTVFTTGSPPATNETLITVPAGFTLNVLSDPNAPGTAPVKIYFAKPFMGFPYVVASFANGDIFHYWLQNNGAWTSSTDYTSASIVLPPVQNGYAYQGVRDFPPNPLWTAETVISSGSYIEPNSATGFCYQAIAVAGTPCHTGQVEPVWPTTAGGIVQEFGDFDVSASDAGTTQATSSVYSTAAPLGGSITDRYGDSATIANAGVFVTSGSTLSTLTLAQTKVTTWKAGTTYAPGATVIPTTNQGAFINAIPDGDFSAGTGWTFTDPGGGLGAGQWGYGTGRPYVGTADIEIPGGTGFGSDGAYATMTSYSLVKPGQSVIATAYLDPNNNGADLELWVTLRWYDSTDTFISQVLSNNGNGSEGGGYRPVTVQGTAPANAAHVRAAIRAGSGTTSRNTGYAGLISWNLEIPAPITNFLFVAVQPNSGVSSATEPSWPTVLGNEVIDNTVTWEAIGTSIITWQAIPLMQSGLTTPSFPTTIGNTVHDFSTYSNQNGYITTTSMSWQCVDRHVIDTNCPQTLPVALGASHVFAGNNDICDYSAAVNPIDWTSTNNAGYLPTGLNNYGDNPIAALALYRGNLVVFNAGGYQLWQIDPDPQNMAFLDAQPVGCTAVRSVQSVANDLLFLTEVGVRNLGTIGATANMAIGDTGQPVDPLVQAAINSATYDPFTIYYPGRGQYWLIYGPQAYVLTINGSQGKKSWSRYIFPEVITDATLNSGSLFLRTSSSKIWQLNPLYAADDIHLTTESTNIISTVQWPYVDMGALGLNKMLVGLDLVGNGACTIQVGFDQTDESTFSDQPTFTTSTGVTAPYFVQIDDTVPGQPLPIPVNAPSYTLILTFDGGTIAVPNDWSWEAANFYLAPAGGGGVTG